jgi:hypothetical protein
VAERTTPNAPNADWLQIGRMRRARRLFPPFKPASLFRLVGTLKGRGIRGLVIVRDRKLAMGEN